MHITMKNARVINYHSFTSSRLSKRRGGYKFSSFHLGKVYIKDSKAA